MKVVDNSGHQGAKKGRGAGGHCFPKDFAALRELSSKKVGKKSSTTKLLETLEKYNIELLIHSKKDLGLLEGIYGSKVARLLD
jgi:UDP-glucose 6-dehydrogenase